MKGRIPILIVLVLLLFALSYLRHTYFLDINVSGTPWLLTLSRYEKISDLASLKGSVSAEGYDGRMDSLFQYWLLFLILNGLIAYVYFKGKKAFRTQLFLFFSVSGLSFLLFFLQNYLFEGRMLYDLASRLKNFLLSPVYTFIAIIFVRYLLSGKYKTDF